MLIIAVIVAVSIGITKAKLDNIVSYTYYNAYSSLRKISTEMLADWDPTDPEYKQALSDDSFKLSKKDVDIKTFLLSLKSHLFVFYRDLWSQPAYARCERWYIEVGKSCQESGGSRCYTGHDEGAGCYACCTCSKKCSPGYLLDSMTCSCKCNRTCQSGYKLNIGSCTCEKLPCTNKPSIIPCGQTWDESTCSLKGTAKTCSDGYSLDSSCNCKCTRTCGSGYSLDSSSCTCVKNKVPCWDGTEADSEAQCPGYVTCWDGSKAHNYDECPPCPNKPSIIPCGQSWDETTCKLLGSEKICPSGQHLNSGCNCVNDCPSAEELTPCRLCSNETGEITKNMAINRTCSDETYEWSEEQCKCIISPRTLPRKGENFCKLFERHSNIMGNTDVCSGSVISDGTTNFADKKADITLRNGLRIYNMHRDATALAILAGNIQGGVYDGVPNTNSYGYTIYIDIDGAKGDSQLWSDVYPFYITLSGKIIPGYDSSNPGVSGGDSPRHLQVSIQYEDYSSGNRRMKWLSKSVTFKEGACQSGYVGEATPYCRNNSAVSKLNECTTDGNSMCTLKHIQPVKFFF